MRTKYLLLPAVSWAAVSLAGASVAFAQAEVTEPEPINENCPCACSWDCCNGPGFCDIFDFLEFQNAFVRGDPCAIDKDTSTGVGVGDIFDFLVFQQEFINGMFGIC